MSDDKTFVPEWTDRPPKPGSWRSIAKFGKPDDIVVPSPRYFELLKRELGLTDDDFRDKPYLGDDPVAAQPAVELDPDFLDQLRAIVGDENLQLDDSSRVRYSRGKLAEEILLLKRGIAGKVSDAVVHPRSTDDVQKIVTLCDAHRVPITTYGGGSSVTKGLMPERGGVTLVLSTHMNRVLEVNELNQTARVQAGCMGPELERVLNNAHQIHHTRHRYTCGHFPQSFEISSVGGWVVTLGSGQASTYYGDAADLVLGVEMVTPTGVIRTANFPSFAAGPKILDIIKGSEGAFGVVVELTIKVFRHMPASRRYFSYLFPSWKAAVEATREICQGEFGLPAVLRISDGEETEHGFQLFQIPTLVQKILELRGYRSGERSVCVGTIEGDGELTRLVARKIRRVARRHRAMRLPSSGVKSWERSRFSSYLVSEPLGDFGVILDTIETPVKWDNLHAIHSAVHGYARRFPNVMCISHASHFYPNGTNLYFIFGMRASIEEYVSFRTGLVDAMVLAGGAPSHHHGIGRLLAPWLETFLGHEQMEVLRALKRHFDPNGIMNPGAQLGLDLAEEERRGV
jgi:alkyldihydroxyacetonephosphate synthase